MKTIKNTDAENMEGKAGLELAPEKLANVSGGSANEEEEADKKKKRRLEIPHLEPEEVNHKRKP